MPGFIALHDGWRCQCATDTDGVASVAHSFHNLYAYCYCSYMCSDVIGFMLNVHFFVGALHVSVFVIVCYMVIVL